MKIIVGLGNPENKYLKSRHNVGFHVVDMIKKKLDFEDFKLKKDKFFSLVSEGQLNNEKVLLVKPITYMNLSGRAVLALYNFYKDLIYSDFWVIYDDLDLNIGTLKIREQGGPGTHNGMKNIVALLRSDKFPRFRVGIDNEELKARVYGEGADYVLGTFDKTEEATANKMIEQCANAVIEGIENGIPNTMNKYNTK